MKVTLPTCRESMASNHDLSLASSTRERGRCSSSVTVEKLPLAAEAPRSESTDPRDSGISVLSLEAGEPRGHGSAQRAAEGLVLGKPRGPQTMRPP